MYPGKFRAISVNRNKKMNELFLKIGEAKITSEKSVTLLRNKIGNKLSFEKQAINQMQ